MSAHEPKPPAADTDALADELEDVVLAAEDVEEVIDDDGAAPEGHEDEPAPETKPEDAVITPEEGEPEARPDTAIAGTFLHKPGSAMFALALHPSFPNPPLAVSGGQDDLGYIFCPLHPGTGSFTRATFPPIPLRGHEDSVVAAAFSTDGEYVATGGLDGRVRVWRHARPRERPRKVPRSKTGAAGTPEAAASGATTPTTPTTPATPDADGAAEGSADAWKYWEFVTSLEAGEVAWLRWHPRGPVLAAGCEDGTVWLWSMPSGRTMTVLSAHNLETTGAVFPPPSGKQLLTTSLDGSLVLWNPSAGTPDVKMNVFAPSHAKALDPDRHGVTSLAVSPNGALIAAGGASGRIRLIAFAQGEVIEARAEIVQTLEGHVKGEGVEALAFVDLYAGGYGGKGLVLVSAGTDGRVILWDTTTGRPRAAMNHPEAVTAIACHPAPCQYVVTTACADRTLRTWDMRSGALLAEHHGHAASVNCVAVSPALDGDVSPLGLPQAQFIASGGDEGASLLFRV